MARVWKTLNQRRRVNYRGSGFKYSQFVLPEADHDAWLVAGFVPPAAEVHRLNEEIHAIELKAFFSAIFLTAVIRPGVLTQQEFDLLKESAEQQIEILRGLEEQSPQIAAVIERLQQQAAAQPEKYGAYIVARNRHDREIRGAVISISEATNRWFGSSLDGTVATVTNVALGLSGTKQLTAPKVRAILRIGRTHGIKRT
jgi:hypothetical protein